jgi:FkbM family methyltransferase
VRLRHARCSSTSAHVGTTAITAVRRFGFQSAVAFEPEEANFRLLRANLSINGLEDRVRTFNIAVSNRVGSAQLKLRPSIGSKHRLISDAEAEGQRTVVVPLTTLDRAVAEGGVKANRASLLWLDVEGHELETLQGAQRLRAHSVPIVMEFIPRTFERDRRLAELGSLLAEHYTDVADLRHRRHCEPLALGALEGLAERYRRGFTDLLVFRRP